MSFGNNEHQQVSKTGFEFHAKIINNGRTTVYRIMIHLDSKVALGIIRELSNCIKTFLLKTKVALGIIRELSNCIKTFLLKTWI